LFGLISKNEPILLTGLALLFSIFAICVLDRPIAAFKKYTSSQVLSRLSEEIKSSGFHIIVQKYLESVAGNIRLRKPSLDFDGKDEEYLAYSTVQEGDTSMSKAAQAEIDILEAGVDRRLDSKSVKREFVLRTLSLASQYKYKGITLKDFREFVEHCSAVLYSEAERLTPRKHAAIALLSMSTLIPVWILLGWGNDLVCNFYTIFSNGAHVHIALSVSAIISAALIICTLLILRHFAIIDDFSHRIKSAEFEELFRAYIEDTVRSNDLEDGGGERLLEATGTETRSSFAVAAPLATTDPAMQVFLPLFLWYWINSGLTAEFLLEWLRSLIRAPTDWVKSRLKVFVESLPKMRPARTTVVGVILAASIWILGIVAPSVAAIDPIKETIYQHLNETGDKFLALMIAPQALWFVACITYAIIKAIYSAFKYALITREYLSDRDDLDGAVIDDLTGQAACIFFLRIYPFTVLVLAFGDLIRSYLLYSFNPYDMSVIFGSLMKVIFMGIIVNFFTVLIVYGIAHVFLGPLLCFIIKKLMPPFYRSYHATRIRLKRPALPMQEPKDRMLSAGAPATQLEDGKLPAQVSTASLMTPDLEGNIVMAIRGRDFNRVMTLLMLNLGDGPEMDDQIMQVVDRTFSEIYQDLEDQGKISDWFVLYRNAFGEFLFRLTVQARLHRNLKVLYALLRYYGKGRLNKFGSDRIPQVRSIKELLDAVSDMLVNEEGLREE
jgi:hypothetical protein